MLVSRQLIRWKPSFTGGDTMWASLYELYDRFSTPWQKFLESLTVTHGSPGLRNLAQKTAEEGKAEVYKGARGAPENTSTEFMGSQVRKCILLAFARHQLPIISMY